MSESIDATKDTNGPEGEKFGFEAEVAKLLKLMVHSVYSDREVFLRELISNASDACDKRRYEGLTNPDMAAVDPLITIRPDVDAKTLTISDNGIGMNREDLIENLGTIARSGTAKFMEALEAGKKNDLSLIGQFGVGFYASFMVADRVDVISRRAGDEAAWQWSSDGQGEYSVAEASRSESGTDIILHLKEDATEFLERARLEGIVRTYSDHIAVPVKLLDPRAEEDEPEALNSGSAIWTRPKSDITEEQYTEFYRHVGQGFDEPALTLHYTAEGMIEYTALLFVPTTRPMDLFDPARKPRVKLYVKRVFITDDTEEMIPGWLRFLRGVVDSQDLPLNISREMLQNNPVLRRIRKALTGKVLAELKKTAEKDPETYTKIWQAFGPVLKEGIYEDEDRRDDLLAISRFASTHGEDMTSLADYVSRMKDKQSAIYYVTGADAKAVARSPQLEGFKAKGIEVLLLSDPVDDFWLSAVSEFDGKPFRSITRGGTDLKDLGGEADKEKAKDRPKEGDLAKLTTALKEVLGDAIAEVRPSDRLTDTAVCLVADDNGLDIHMERILKAHNQLGSLSPKVLEINPDHALIKALVPIASSDGATTKLEDAAWLLLDQARVLEGEVLEDPIAFSRRLSNVMARAVG